MKVTVLFQRNFAALQADFEKEVLEVAAELLAAGRYEPAECKLRARPMVLARWQRRHDRMTDGLLSDLRN